MTDVLNMSAVKVPGFAEKLDARFKVAYAPDCNVPDAAREARAVAERQAPVDAALLSTGDPFREMAAIDQHAADLVTGETLDDVAGIDAGELRRVGVDRGDEALAIAPRMHAASAAETEEVGGVDDVALGQGSVEAEMKGREIGMAGALFQEREAPGAELRAVILEADIVSERLDAILRAEKVHREVEIAAPRTGGFGETFPAFDVAAGGLAMFQSHKDRDAQRRIARRQTTSHDDSSQTGRSRPGTQPNPQHGGDPVACPSASGPGRTWLADADAEVSPMTLAVG